jgi:hypothetical protein
VRNPWLAWLEIAGRGISKLPFGSKKKAVTFCREWVSAGPDRAATITPRQSKAGLVRVDVINGRVCERQLPNPLASTTRRKPAKSDSERFDYALRNQGLSVKQARSARSALIRVLQSTLGEHKRVWTPAGELSVEFRKTFRRTIRMRIHFWQAG